MPEMKFTKVNDDYQCGDYTIAKVGAQWRCYLKGKSIANYPKTLKAAKACCEEHELNEAIKQRQISKAEATASLTEDRLQAAAKAVDYSADLGVSWFQWVELRLNMKYEPGMRDKERLAEIVREQIQSGDYENAFFGLLDLAKDDHEKLDWVEKARTDHCLNVDHAKVASDALENLDEDAKYKLLEEILTDADDAAVMLNKAVESYGHNLSESMTEQQRQTWAAELLAHSEEPEVMVRQAMKACNITLPKVTLKKKQQSVKACDLPAQPGDDIKLDGDSNVSWGEVFGRKIDRSYGEADPLIAAEPDSLQDINIQLGNEIVDIGHLKLLRDSLDDIGLVGVSSCPPERETSLNIRLKEILSIAKFLNSLETMEV